MRKAPSASPNASTFTNSITVRNWKVRRVALFGVMDGRKSGDNEGCSEGPARIREVLYRLTPHAHWQTTIDLGDLEAPNHEADTAAAVQSVVAELTQQGIIPVVLGGGQDLTTTPCT